MSHTISDDMIRRQENSLTFAKMLAASYIFEQICVDPNGTFDEAVQHYVWGNHGPNGNQPVVYKKLVDCDTEHLENILATQHGASEFTKRVVIAILRDRYR